MTLIDVRVGDSIVTLRTEMDWIDVVDYLGSDLPWIGGPEIPEAPSTYERAVASVGKTTGRKGK